MENQQNQKNLKEIHKFNPKTDYDLYYENTDSDVLKLALYKLKEVSYFTPKYFIQHLHKDYLLELEDMLRKSEAYARNSSDTLYHQDHKNLVILVRTMMFAEGIFRATTGEFVSAIQQLSLFVNLEISKRFYNLQTELYFKQWSLVPELLSFKKE